MSVEAFKGWDAPSPEAFVEEKLQWDQGDGKLPTAEVGEPACDLISCWKRGTGWEASAAH